ncbi:hypothetical protein [Rubripirellula tenax]|uniref:hypothetical protein n=1 Tax=Rubripirellula tenax TaxID=2528015 RepID=UPI0011B71067|nr:hypothetical protein [Rubripirellula tenax]
MKSRFLNQVNRERLTWIPTLHSLIMRPASDQFDDSTSTRQRITQCWNAARWPTMVAASSCDCMYDKKTGIDLSTDLRKMKVCQQVSYQNLYM